MWLGWALQVSRISYSSIQLLKINVYHVIDRFLVHPLSLFFIFLTEMLLKMETVFCKTCLKKANAVWHSNSFFSLFSSFYQIQIFPHIHIRSMHWWLPDVKIDYYQELSCLRLIFSWVQNSRDTFSVHQFACMTAAIHTLFDAIWYDFRSIHAFDFFMLKSVKLTAS